MIAVIALAIYEWTITNWLPLAGIAWMYVGIVLFIRPVKPEQVTEITLTLPLDPGQAPRDE